MKKVIYLILFTTLLTSCVTSKQTTHRRTEKEAKELIEYAGKFIGTPYVYGGTTPKGFDFIHVSSSVGVRTDSSELSYYKIRYVTARRIIGTQ